MKVLGIETSCDETGVAVYDAERGLLAHRLYTQVAMHAAYGGVVPELASRDHVRKTVPLIREVLAAAGLAMKDLSGVAYTAGPGLIGALLDDAAGDAFDKTAKTLGLGSPGGPALEKLARQGRAGRFRFPRPMTNRPGLDFSFSGLKTHALNTFAGSGGDAQSKADIARAFSEAVIDTLAIKCRRALKQTGLRTLIAA